MLIVYDSFSGKVKKFVSKLPEDFEVRHIDQYDGTSLYYLITSTINFGQVLDTTAEFMKKHSSNCLGVSSSGNKVWGRNYGKAAFILSEKYNIPFISRFEVDGTKEDVSIFIERVLEIEYNRRN